MKSSLRMRQTKSLVFTERLVEIIKKLKHPENIPEDEKDALFRTIKEKILSWIR